MSFLCIAALLLAYAVLKYFCIFRSSMLARLALLKKSCAILHSHLCVLLRCCSCLRCSSTFVHSAPLCSRALHYPKNPAQFCILIFVYCFVAARICGARVLLYTPLRYIRAPCTTQKILRNFALSFLCIAALLLAYAVLEYLCTLRSAMLARLTN